MSAASDTDILKYASTSGHIIVTLDADFHAILVVSGMTAPSVIRIRLEGLKGPAIRDDCTRNTRRLCAGYRSRLHDHRQGAQNDLPPALRLQLIVIA